MRRGGSLVATQLYDPLSSTPVGKVSRELPPSVLKSSFPLDNAVRLLTPPTGRCGFVSVVEVHSFTKEVLVELSIPSLAFYMALRLKI